MSELYMMVTITNRKYMSKFAALYRENQIEVGTVSLGMGTASSSILDYMGLEDDEKSICFHFVTEATWKKVKKGFKMPHLFWIMVGPLWFPVLPLLSLWAPAHSMSS